MKMRYFVLTTLLSLTLIQHALPGDEQRRWNPQEAEALLKELFQADKKGREGLLQKMRALPPMPLKDVEGLSGRARIF